MSVNIWELMLIKEVGMLHCSKRDPVPTFSKHTAIDFTLS